MLVLCAKAKDGAFFFFFFFLNTIPNFIDWKMLLILLNIYRGLKSHAWRSIMCSFFAMPGFLNQLLASTVGFVVRKLTYTFISAILCCSLLYPWTGWAAVSWGWWLTALVETFSSLLLHYVFSFISQFVLVTVFISYLLNLWFYFIKFIIYSIALQLLQHFTCGLQLVNQVAT